jgi:hypothetical protein
MYELNGQEFTLETLQGKAQEYNMSFEDYIEAMKKKGLVEKTNGSQIEDATAEPVDTASSSEDTSLGSQDDTVYKAGLLPEVEIEAERGDDIVIRNPWGRGSFSVSRKGWGSFFFGRPEEKTEQAQAAELADEYMDAIHGVTTKDQDVQDAIAESYFNFSAMENRFKTERVYSPSQKSYILQKVVSDDEQDYKNYFGDTKEGKAKFEVWKKYNETGELDLENIPSQNIASGKNNIKSKKAELFNERLSDKEREDYQYFLYGDKATKDNKDEVDFEKEYGRPLVRTETIKGRTYVPSEKAREQRFKQEADKQNAYLNFANSSIKKEIESFEKEEAEYMEASSEFTTEYNKINDELDKLGLVTSDSNPKLIDQYNSLVSRASELKKNYEQSGLQEVYQSLITKSESLNSKSQDLYDKAELFNNTQIAKKAATLNYSNTERAALQLEKAFLGGGAMLATSSVLGLADIADYFVDGYNKSKAVEAGTDREALASVSDTMLYEYLKQGKNASVDYYRMLGDKLQDDFSRNIDFEWNNIGVWLPQAFANNSPSIVAIAGTMGTAGLVTRAASPLFSASRLAGDATRFAAKANRAALMKNASRLAQASFFTIAGGQKAGDLQIEQQDAPLIIEGLKQSYDLAKTNDEKLLIAKQIAEQEDALSMTELQKAFSYTVHGGVELLTEKLGSLNAIQNFRRFSKAVGGGFFKRSGRLAADIGIAQTIELTEELAAQLLQNGGEIVIEGKDKSLIEGIDKNFFANTIVTGLAIQGGNIGSNMYNIVKSEVQTAKEIEKSNELMEELIEIQDVLQKGIGLSSKDRQLILKRKKEIIKEAALADVTTVQKLNRLSKEEIELAFELARKRRAKLKEISELGYTGDVSKFMQKQKEKLLEEFRQIENQRSELLSKNEKAKLDKAKDLADPAKAVYASGLNDLYSDLAKYSLSKSKGEYVEIKGQVIDGELIPKNPFELLEELTEKYGAEIAGELVSEYLNGANAGFVGNDIIVFQDNIDSKIYSDKVDDIETLIAAVSPMHEVLHGKNKEAGLIKDGKLVESARIATEGIEALLKEKLDQGRISQEAFDSYINRRDELYTDKDGVNAEEMINLVNDLVAIGALSQGDFRSLFGFKSFVNSLAKRFLGDESLFYPLETADDIFGYVKSFQKEFKGSNLLLTGKEEESEAKLSKARKTVLEEINNLIPVNVQTNDQYNEFLNNERNFMALYNAMQENGVISNYVKSRTISRAEYAEAIDSIVMRLRNFKPDAIREKGPKKGEKVGREGFGEFIFANTNFGKLDAKKALAIKAEEAKQTKSLDADESFVQVADESAAFDEKATPTKEKAKKPKINVLRIGKVATKEKQIVDSVEIKEGDTFKEVLANNTGKIGEVIFNVPSAKLTDPAKNLTYAKKFVDGIPESSEAGNIQSFFDDVETVRGFIKILPRTNVSEQAADINLLGENIDVSRDVLGLGLGTSNNILKYFYNKTTKRSKGKKSQPFIWELKDEFVNPSKEQIEQFQAALGITPRGQLNNYDRNIGQLLKGAAKMMAGQTSLSAAQRQLEAELKTAKPEQVKAIKQQTADITAAQNKVAFSRGKKAAEKYKYERLDLNKEQAKEDFIDWVKEVGSKKMPRSFWEASGNLLGSGAKYKTLIIDDKEVKEYFLKGGGTILETDPDYNNNLLNLMPEGKMVFANRAQMNEAFKGVDFAPENLKIKDSTKRVTLYGKKSGKQVKELITKKKDFLNNSDRGFIDTWLTIAKDIKNNPSNRRFWAAWLEVTPQNMSHFMRVGARLAFYNTLNLTNVEEHTSPATDFAFELWGLANEGKLNESSIKKAMESYIQGSLPKIFDNLLKGEGFNYIDAIPEEYRSQVFEGEIPVWIRYINEKVNAQKYMLDGVEYSGINPNVIVLADGKTLAQQFSLGVPSKYNFNQDVISVQQELLLDVFTNKISIREASNKLKVALAGASILKELKQKRDINKSISEGILKVRPVLQYTKSSRGMSTFDFDETLIIDGENFVTATKGSDVVRIPSDKWPIDGPTYAQDGYTFDFSDFVNVRGGKEGPLLQKMRNQIKKYGSDNVFVLTARMQEAAEPIHEWLKSQGINIPLENITGLGKSEGDAKAQWFIDKYAEGYNDMYFVDDALPNVEAVKHVFNQLDIKGKSVQARVKFSKSMSSEFNKMIERKKGVGAEKVFSRVVGQKRGKNIGRYRFFVPPSAEDFAGLLYDFYGKGKQGDADMEFMKKALLDPFGRADREMSMARMSILQDYKTLRKALPEVKKKLGKIIDKNTGFTFDNAVRVYLFDKAGFKVPGISKRDLEYLRNVVKTDQDLKTFADTLGLISKKKEGYIEPGEYWSVETIASDLENMVNKIGRKQFLAEWIENKNIIFSPENMNKIEAIYGSRFRSALEDSLYRMENGTNRSKDRNYGQSWTNWVNGSVGAIMFFNGRSAVLQTLSIVNFINYDDNNIFAAGKALANQKQYWSDFSTLFNSDFLKARRAGLQINVNEAELANAVAGAQNKAKAALAYLLKKGFLPTQIADSFAIASGGATFYRNRIKTYLKQGMDQKAAEEKAFLDFQEIAQETQQSSRPDRISQQQASPLGRLILAFANTPMQYNRLIKKAARDLINNRGDWRSNISRILYYGAIQNVIFSALQSAIFALSFDDEEDDELDKRTMRVANTMIDTILRGSGVTGAAVATIKNTIMRFIEESERESRADYGQVVVEALQVSPPMGSKARKLYSALNAYKFNREIMGSMDTFDYNNPIWDAIGNVTTAATNVPLDRLFRKTDNIKEAFNQENSAMQRTFLLLGWSSWDLQVGERVVVNKGKKNEYVKYLDTKRQAQEEAKEELKETKKKEKRARQRRCTGIKSDGTQCSIMVTKPKTRCHYHD